MDANLKDPRPCERCKGAGEYHSDYAKFDQATKEFSPGMERCSPCEGRGVFPGLDVPGIMDAIRTTRGAKKFRKSMVSPTRKEGIAAARAYYVWRLARFHGGADVTMPMMADLVTRCDPFKRELDALSEMVAKKVYGTDMAAATRWGRALGYNVPDSPNLPASAQSGGPVHDGNDPLTTAMLEDERREAERERDPD